MEQSRKLSKLISTVYQAATDANRLPQVLDSIAGEIGADLAALAIGERGSGNASFMVVTGPGSDPGYTIDYGACFRPWIAAVLQGNPDCFCGHKGIEPDLTAINGSETLFGGGDFRGGCSSYFYLNGSRYGFLGFCSKKGRTGFDAQQIATLDLLLPHIKQAFGINLYLDEVTVLHDVTQERYQKSFVGIVLLDESGKVVFSNPIAKYLLDEPGGIGMQDGRLHTESAGETATLNSLVARSIQAARIKGTITDGFMAVSRTHLDKPPLSLSVSSYARKQGARTVSASNGRALVVIFDPQRRQITQEYILERLYALTATESALATSLADGKTLAELAAENAVSRETLRSQLKRVFQKTHTRRQSELVKLVLTGPGSLVI